MKYLRYCRTMFDKTVPWRTDARLTMLYKISNQTVAISKADRLLPPLRQTRNLHSQAYQIPSCRTQSRKCSFFPQTIRDWNDLPLAVVLSDSVESFKAAVVTIELELEGLHEEKLVIPNLYPDFSRPHEQKNLEEFVMATINRPALMHEEEEDDEDFVDETFSERLWGLTEMFPDTVRNSFSTLATFSWNSAKFSLGFSKTLTWTAVSSLAVLVLPVFYEKEKANMQEQQMMQQRQLLMGPNAAMSGQQSGGQGMMGMMPPGMAPPPTSVAPPPSTQS